MTDESLSEIRRAAGRKGAQARWGARNQAPATDGDDLVCGTADELRRLAEALTDGDQRAATSARTVSNRRVSAFKARHPQANAATLAGRMYCEAALDDPPSTAPRLRLVNEAADVAELWLYGYIDSWGYPFGISAAEVVEMLDTVTAPRIDVHINSYGGEVFEGIAIKRALASHDAAVDVRIDGVAASIASVIAMAGDTVAVDSLAMMMIHDASGFCLGNATDMLTMANLLDKISDVIASAYATRAGGDVRDWRTRMLAESWYTAAEAVDIKLADGYLDGDQADDEPIAAAASPSLLTAFAAATKPQDEPPAALSFLRAAQEAIKS